MRTRNAVCAAEAEATHVYNSYRCSVGRRRRVSARAVHIYLYTITHTRVILGSSINSGTIFISGPKPVRKIIRRIPNLTQPDAT